MSKKTIAEFDDYKCLNVSVVDGVGKINLNRPEQLNAISFSMAEELKRAVENVAWRSDVKVLLFSGAGRAFCAGYDVTTPRSGRTPREKMRDAVQVSSALDAIRSAPVVRVAQLHGHVVGAGLALALQCHLRYAAVGTRFSVPELDFGIPFLLGGASLLTRELGPVRAADMILNCAPFVVEKGAATNGLVTEVLNNQDLKSRVDEVVAKLSQRPEALLMATVATLDRANQDLLAPAPTDMFHGFFVRSDPESQQVGATYVTALKGKDASRRKT